MSSISIGSAKEVYGGATEEETLRNMAKSGARRIYKYANDFGDKITHTDYKQISNPGDPQEVALHNSPHVHNVVLVYDGGEVMNI
jgi:hypothetical protein